MNADIAVREPSQDLVARVAAEDPRFWAKVQVTPTGCWVWKGNCLPNGYPRLTRQGTGMYAHRYAFSRWREPIKSGLVVDHLCCVRNCVNPMHLEAVTPEENHRRSTALMVLNRAHCPKGHPYVESNIEWEGRARRCRVCRREQKRQSERRCALRRQGKVA